MTNKQYRKKTLKGSFLTRQYREGLILIIIIKRRPRHLFSEQRQPLTTEYGLTTGNYSDLRKNKDLHNELNYYVNQSTGHTTRQLTLRSPLHQSEG
jgi:hypothetical protein